MTDTNFESEALSAKDIAQIERLRLKSGLPQTLSDKALLFGWNKYRQQLVKTSGFLISIPAFLLVVGLQFIDTPPEISWGAGEYLFVHWIASSNVFIFHGTILK